MSYEWWLRTFILKLLILLSTMSCHKPPGQLTAIESLPGYASGSGLAYLNQKFFIMGDDAPYMLITDSLFKVVDKVSIFSSGAKRIAKDEKQDMEAIALIRQDTNPLLLLLGSGSMSPRRDSCIILNPLTQEKKHYSLTLFYERLKTAGIRDLNIEGAASLPGGMILASRGNKNFPQNNLVITSEDFWDNQQTAWIKLIKTGFTSDSSFFNGISGMDYSYKTDKLLLTVSTEDTNNSYDDGAIGKSYLWIIDNISTKKEFEGINPDKIIDLEDIDPRFKGQKIESVCIVEESKDHLHLVLVADDDKGGTVLFRVVISQAIFFVGYPFFLKYQ